MSDAPTTPLANPSLTLPVVPLSSTVVLPGAVATLALESDEARHAAAQARQGDGRVLLVPQVEHRYAKVGTIAHVENMGELPDGTVAAILRTVQRAVIGAGVAGDGLWVSAEPVDDPAPTPQQREVTTELRVVLEQIAEQRRSRRLPEILRTVHEPGALADAVTAWADQEVDEKLAVLEAVDVDHRLQLVLTWARQALAELMMAERIRNDVAEGMDKAQREFLLRQQMTAIRKELGDGDDDALDDYRSKAAALPLPENVRAQVDREIDRLERSSGQSPEQSWIRTWLDRVLELPWGKRSDDRLDMLEARAVLDADHTGLDEVKDRIVEYLGVRKLRTERGMGEAGEGRRGAGAIIALIGPPGVGKTSLGESVARAMGRSFVRVALGGVRDEAEIRGHRRTYVGAQPGRLVRAITEAGTMNPVVLLDEVDKLSAGGWSGDPSSALLEVLDPAQNHTFRDHYLEVELDLSDVVFIATANVADTIPGPLLDRMEVVRLDGYTEDEKVVIARDHLLPGQLDRNGLRPDDVDVDEAAIRHVVVDYTREAGVRNLERELGKVLRKVAAKVATDPTLVPVHIDEANVESALGRPKFFAEAADRTATPGVATGLAVTGTGGDVLFIEASASDGEPGLTLTGQLGDVMKESVQIALSFVRAHAVELGIAPSALERRFHVHVPAGAVPKDGPSAGVTMTTALVSLLTDRPVRAEVGMTGEVTLQGRVLPIGGVKQKVLAAHRAGLTEVVLPKRNGPDLDDVPERVRAVMKFHLADDVHDVLDIARADERARRRIAVREPAASQGPRAYDRAVGSHLSDVWFQVTDLQVASGKGSWVTTTDGTEYLDFSSGIAVTSTGHCHPRVVAAIQEQATKFIHAQVNVYRHPLLDQLADRLAEITPDGIDRFFFANSGAEATEAAVKLAKQTTRRPNTIVFQGSFHGRTHQTMAMTTSKTSYRAGHAPLPAGVFVAPFPADDAHSDWCLDQVRLLLKSQTAPSETAAMVIEPELGEGGYLPAPVAFLRGLAEICAEHGILFVADEVQTGFGRTGKMFAVEHYDVRPDVMVLAKGLGSGFPISAIGASDALMARWPKGSHGGTYGGNPLGCAAALATIDVLTEPGFLDNVHARGEQLRAGLTDLARHDPGMVDVRGWGLMVGSQFSDPARVSAVQAHCLDEGHLILMNAGTNNDVLRWMPPLVVTEAEIATALAAFAAALKSTA